MATAPTVGKTCLPGSDYWDKINDMMSGFLNTVHESENERRIRSRGQLPADGQVVRKEIIDD